MDNENCARLCQTEIALVPSSPLTDLYNIITYIDQEKIDEDAVRIIDIPQNAKRRSILPVSKFGLTDLSRQDEKYFRASSEETTGRKNKTKEMSSQTDLMVSPHILIEEEKAIISMSSSCQTFISCSPSISLVNFEPQPELKKYSDPDDGCDDEEEQLYKNAAEILTEIVHDVRMMKPVYGKPNCSTENSEWETMISEGNNTTHSQVKENIDDGTYDLIVDNSCKGDILYCRSDDDVSEDSNVTEKSSVPSLGHTENMIVEDVREYAEIVENCEMADMEDNLSKEENIK